MNERTRRPHRRKPSQSTPPTEVPARLQKIRSTASPQSSRRSSVGRFNHTTLPPDTATSLQPSSRSSTILTPISTFNPTMPLLDDPSCPGTSFNHRWTEENYTNFKSQIKRYVEWAREAHNDEDEDLSIKAWQELFGPEFVASDVTLAKSAILASGRNMHSDNKALVVRTQMSSSSSRRGLRSRRATPPQSWAKRPNSTESSPSPYVPEGSSAADST